VGGPGGIPTGRRPTFQTLFTNTANKATHPTYSHVVVLRLTRATLNETIVLDVGNKTLGGRRSIESRRLAIAQQRLHIP
jgi:hypothetical protein